MSKKTNYDSDFCGSLPLSTINVIQDYGYLVVVEKSTFKILQVSENSTELFDWKLAEIVGNPLSDFVVTDHLRSLEERFAGNVKVKVPLTLAFRNNNISVLGHFSERYIVLEIEKYGLPKERTFSNVYEEVKYAVAAIESATTIEDVSKIAIHELRKITGFDGMMMYRFDSEWNGTVIAEEKVEDLEKYLGHTFPASDVPKQARDLYLKHPYRLIPDRDFKPVRLYPVVNPITNTFIDLSDCNLRGVAAVHLEYLKNMNVKASMSIRVLNNENLWGLIACHHLSPRYLDFEICSVCEMLSSVISNKISGLLNKITFDLESELQKQQTELIAKVYSENDVITGLIDEKATNLMTLLDATGIAIQHKNAIRSIGQIPETDIVENLMLWLQNKQVEKVFHTDHLPNIFGEVNTVAEIASGALAIPLNFEDGEYIVAFRPEVVQTINWGGDPNTAINFEPDGKKYHPRASFKLWQQKVHNTSSPWKKEEIEVAENLRSFIYEFNIKKSKK